MEFLIDTLLGQWPLWLVGGFLAISVLAFLLVFVRRAWGLWRELGRTLTALRAVGKPVNNLDAIRDALALDSLRHLWAEYTETLHPERREVDGQSRVVCYRATALAETFFSERVLVDTPLKTEFWKHVPGILTGLGIIGTFFGLIQGLSNFDIADPARAQIELAQLINAVGHAFVVSAVAIGLAILFTVLEKFLVTACYRRVETLAQLIDGFFDAGVGEEYLERLVKAAESQTTQAIQIKDALVTELQRLSQQQIEAHQAHMIQLAQNLGTTIGQQLGQPIADIAQAVQRVGANQGEAVHQLLTDVLAGFTARIEELFGGQIRGLTQLLEQTSQAMAQTTQQLSNIAANLEQAGGRAADAMTERLNHAITSLEARQQAMNRQMGEFVTKIRDLVVQTQAQSTQVVEENLARVGEQVNALQQGTRETNTALQQAVERLTEVTTTAIDGMNAGAERLQTAANNFAQAGQGVAQTLQASQAVAADLRAASELIAESTEKMENMVRGFAATRDSVEGAVTNLRNLVETLRQENSTAKDLLAKITEASEQLGTAEAQAKNYLEAINKVLDEAHRSFAEHLRTTLGEGNKELQTAVGIVSNAVRELGEAIDQLAALQQAR